MAQRWVKRAATRVGRVLFTRPTTWTGLARDSAVALVATFALADVFGWYDLRHQPGPPLLLAVALFGGQVFAFARDRRPSRRPAEPPFGRVERWLGWSAWPRRSGSPRTPPPTRC